MSQDQPISIEKIQLEAVHFSAQDSLLNFSAKGENQSPLILSASDFFYTKWSEKGAPISLETFFPVSANFSAAQKEAALKQFKATLKEKKEDFCDTDLYLVLGFLKYDENALAPALLIPLETDPSCRLLQISRRRPLENVVLRRKLENIVTLPKATDAVINGKFDIKLYFGLFEKAVTGKYKWKFTRNGICLAFFNSMQVLLMKNFLRPLWKRAEIIKRPIFNTLLGDGEFPITDSLFEDVPYDNLYNPADHCFLHTLDSGTNKAVIDAQNEKTIAYAIQTLPGSEKAKAAANIAADIIARDKKVLVISRRATTKQEFLNALFPKMAQNSSLDRNQILAKLGECRKSLVSYYNTVNKQLQPSNTSLAKLLHIYKKSSEASTNIPEKVFDDTAALDYSQFKSLHAALEQITKLYFSEGGLDASETFKDVKKTNIKADDLYTIRDDLKATQEATAQIREIAKIFGKTDLFPSGITLDELSETIALIQEAFNDKTPEFENWNLHSSGWESYQDDLKALPSAGSKWINYRRQTSDIYVDSAIDENVLENRDIFASNYKSPLKGLSDQYRKAKKQLLTLFKNPKNYSTDAQILEGVDNLITLQENRRAYKSCAVIGNHLLGKDWLFEKSNWAFLTIKIRYFYDFKNKFKNHAQYKTLIKLLEQWHLIKPYFEKFESLLVSITELKRILENISITLELDTPLEKESIDKWANIIPTWSDKWNSLDVHMQLNTLITEVEKTSKSLAEFLKHPEWVYRELSQSFALYWSSIQIQQAVNSCPDLLNAMPGARLQKSAEFRTLSSELCTANANYIRNKLSKVPILLNNVGLAQSFELIPRETYDVTLFLDADCTSIVESMPGIILSKRAIFMGDPQTPYLEPLPADKNIKPSKSPVFLKSILGQILRKYGPNREIGFTSLYADASLVEFANERIYARKIKQLPSPSRQAVRRLFLKETVDKVNAIAQAVVSHAERKPNQSLGVIAFDQATCEKLAKAIQALPKSPAATQFLGSLAQDAFFIKTPEKAVQKHRDVIIVCCDIDEASGTSGEHKLSVCTTLATQKLYLVVSKADLALQANAKPGLVWDWISNLRDDVITDITPDTRPTDSKLGHEVLDYLREKHIPVEEYASRGRIPIGPIIQCTGNPKQNLVIIEDDCTTCQYRESVEDREIVRFNLLSQLGWRIINVRLPLWILSNDEEKKRLLATIEKQQASVPAPQEDAVEDDEDFSCSGMTDNIVPYEVIHPKIEGTPHDKPIAELTPSLLTIQLKFYVDRESPIHEEILTHRLLELHRIDRAGPIIRRTLNDAIKNALLQQMFTKAGSFFYTVNETKTVLRDRSSRPDFERKLAYVPPEEQALLLNAGKQNIKELLGLI